MVTRRRIARRALLVSLLFLICLPPAGAAGDSDTIRVASWNVLNLGAKTPVGERAKVISQFDIVALQEVESLTGMERLRVAVAQTTGVDWKAVVSERVGNGQAAEYYAFLYRSDRVTQTQGPLGVYPQTSAPSFSRPPYFATFRAGKFDFTLITVHITFATPASLRTEEVRRLKQVWQYVQTLDPKEQGLLLIGDFNRNRPTHAAFGPLRNQLVLSFLIKGDAATFTTYGTKKSKVGASWYDNIWMASKHTAAEYDGQSGIDYTYKHFYTNETYPHLKVRKGISDHCPVWAEFETTGPDDD